MFVRNMGRWLASPLLSARQLRLVSLERRLRFNAEMVVD
jgi:hypothetical protein